MSDIFTDNNIYPHKEKIKDHFKDFYNTAFVAFLPFFKVEKPRAEKTNYKKSKQITFDEAIENLEIFKDIPEFDADIFSYRNDDYPSSSEIFNTGVAIRWKDIIKGAELENSSELNKALRTSIGGLRQFFQRPELAKKLNNYTDSESIWHPTEGSFDAISLVAIYKVFKLLRKNQIVLVDEFYKKTRIIELNKLNEFEFHEKVDFKDYYLYSSDREILFTIEWDSFFFLIATNNDNMRQILDANLFEGFLCEDTTIHNWDYKEGELQALLVDEEKQITNEAKTKKPWWKFWN